MKKVLSVLMALCMVFAMTSVISSAATVEDTHQIVLSSTEKSGVITNTATIDGETVKEYDYTWSVDPSQNYNEVKNSPAEHYSGTKPTGEESVYIAHDIKYYPTLPTSGYKKVQYDDETEWAYYYTADGFTDFIFATLPVNGNSVPTSMMHTAEEAYTNAVLHITEAGIYSLSGTWKGQILIDLDDAEEDAAAKVTLILNGVDITCTVAPAVNFYSVYECDENWEDSESYSAIVNTENAGAKVIINDGTVNNVSGANVFRMLKAKAKDDDEQSSNKNSVTLQKKLIKTDAAFYSYCSMNISGNGTLNITSTYEGLDSEHHLTINGGNINIYSQDDGINVNEDKVSVLTFNGGITHIFAGLGTEGDGIDSNGYLVVNGGTLISTAKSASDSGLDSDCGTYIYGGTVVALGSTMDGVSEDKSGKGQVTANFKFSSMQNSDEAIILTDTDGNVIFAYDPNQDEIAKNYARTYQGAIISSPDIKQGVTYNLYVGGDVYGTATNGLFTSANATGFSDDAVKQTYGGSSIFNPFGGGGTTPPEIPSGEQGQQPGEQSSQQTTGQNQQSGEQGQQEKTQIQQPTGQEQQPSDVNDNSNTSSTSDFTMTNIVNNFSNVSDGSTSSVTSIFEKIIKLFTEFIQKLLSLFSF